MIEPYRKIPGKELWRNIVCLLLLGLRILLVTQKMLMMGRKTRNGLRRLRKRGLERKNRRNQRRAKKMMKTMNRIQTIILLVVTMMTMTMMMMTQLVLMGWMMVLVSSNPSPAAPPRSLPRAPKFRRGHLPVAKEVTLDLRMGRTPAHILTFCVRISWVRLTYILTFFCCLIPASIFIWYQWEDAGEQPFAYELQSKTTPNISELFVS